jgi:hypothetical protein
VVPVGAVLTYDRQTIFAIEAIDAQRTPTGIDQPVPPDAMPPVELSLETSDLSG